jgi:hypothetical protein
MRSENHVVLLSVPTVILGEIKTKNCFGLIGEVPFITYRHQSNLQCL